VGWIPEAGSGRLDHGATDVPARAEQAGRRLVTLREWRMVLAVVALTQLVVAWPGVVLSAGHASAHMGHELVSLDIGLAVGFLFLAWRPSRAWGALPLVTPLVLGLVGAAAWDAVDGHALLGREVVHLLELAGLACTWALARRAPRSSIELRLG
jgi:predicted anti-sigma-YlaC factor YlaD